MLMLLDRDYAVSVQRTPDIFLNTLIIYAYSSLSKHTDVNLRGTPASFDFHADGRVASIFLEALDEFEYRFGKNHFLQAVSSPWNLSRIRKNGNLQYTGRMDYAVDDNHKTALDYNNISTVNSWLNFYKLYSLQDYTFTKREPFLAKTEETTQHEPRPVWTARGN